MAKKSDIEKLLAHHGFKIEVASDGELTLEPTVLRLKQIKVKLVKRGRYITDPELVPPELQDQNVLWVTEPPVVTATTMSGEEIDVLVPEAVYEYHEVHPDDE